MKNEILATAITICHTLLNLKKKNNEEVTDQTLLDVIEQVKSLNISEDLSFDKRDLFERLKADFSIGKGSISILEDTDKIQPWLNEEKTNIHFELWNRYKQDLLINNPSFPVNELDDFTDKILDKCVNPKQQGTWDRRGMVVGHVQSGKTANYIGLINKATDAGYKLIIIIAGTISSLRRQTQERVDSGYIGRSSSAFNNKRENKIIGVGKSKVNTEIYSLTSSYYNNGEDGDFSQSVANKLNIPIGKNPVVLVIKKNKSILENLIDWLSRNENIQTTDGQPRLLSVPALIIDDEADAASVNATKDINEVKTINRLIRTLLNMFDQNTFIGYTATPYANLFIPQEHNTGLTTTVKGKPYKIGEDLFPRDFIINLQAPDNYIGAAKIFGYEHPLTGEEHEPLEIYRETDDFDPPFFKHINKTNKTQLPEELPKSLEKAIQAFILTCAIRRVRGHEKKHNSMLIHVALLVKWIDRIALLVNEKLRIYKNNIQSKDEDFFYQLRQLYIKDFVPTTMSTKDNLPYTDIRIEVDGWDEIEKELPRAAAKIEVRAVHGIRSTTGLEYHNIDEIDYNLYKDGLSVIAVGGSRLSRGITLEGLSISYYLRTTRMYDTLMQMGRWFGYRPGYADLCRLYTTQEIFDWFNHITMATEEMRNDFDEMTASLKKPKDFPLKVRNHPGLLTITSVAKLNFTEHMQVTFSGANPQTWQLLKAPEAIRKNFATFNQLISTIGFPPETNRIKNKAGRLRQLLYRNQPVEAICEFIENFQTEQPNIRNNALTDYIRRQQEEKTITEWSICIVSNTDEKVFIDPTGNTPVKDRKNNQEASSFTIQHNGETLTLTCTVRNQRDNRNGPYYLINRNQIDSRSDREADLTIQGNKNNIDIKKQRATEKKGLLLIYALDERGTPGVNEGIPIIGYSLHFPRVTNETPVSYTSVIRKDFNEETMEDDDIQTEN